MFFSGSVVVSETIHHDRQLSEAAGSSRHFRVDFTVKQQNVKIKNKKRSSRSTKCFRDHDRWENDEAQSLRMFHGDLLFFAIENLKILFFLTYPPPRTNQPPHTNQPPRTNLSPSAGLQLPEIPHCNARRCRDTGLRNPKSSLLL